MKYFFDTEFNENGKTIELISIGIVAEDGREYYACNNELDLGNCNPWVRENVLPHLPPFDRQGMDCKPVWKTRGEMANEIQTFVMGVPGRIDTSLRDEKPEFYAYFADYDWVVFCQLYGRMIDLPKGFPMYCRDLKQIMYHLNVSKDALPKQTGTEHDALEDAKWNKAVFDALSEIATGLRL